MCNLFETIGPQDFSKDFKNNSKKIQFFFKKNLKTNFKINFKKISKKIPGGVAGPGGRSGWPVQVAEKLEFY